MPTHQQKTQTDIIIGSGGGGGGGGSSESISIDSKFEFTVTYGASANFQYKDNAPGGDNEDSSYELQILDSTGGTLAIFAAEYTCEPVTGTATDVSSTRTNTFSLSPNGNSPSLPSGSQTLANRDWQITATKGNQPFGGFAAGWKFVSTVASGGTVRQTVNSQNDGELDITLVYFDSSSTVLEVGVVCSVAVSSSSPSIQFGAPNVTDDIQP